MNQFPLSSFVEDLQHPLQLSGCLGVHQVMASALLIIFQRLVLVVLILQIGFGEAAIRSISISATYFLGIFTGTTGFSPGFACWE